jgi:hypothetical protein
MSGIATTGNSQVDTATAEIAVALRDGRGIGHGWREQDHCNEAMRLRDEIMAGTREMDAVTPPAHSLNDHGDVCVPDCAHRIWVNSKGDGDRG